MTGIEQNIKTYFESWLKKDRSNYPALFSKDVLYVECYGPAYRGLDEINQWFDDWNQRGTVLRWDLKQILFQNDTAVCEWYFECEYDGEVGGFNGVSLIVFNQDNQIVELKEFQSKTPNYFPYAHLKANWRTDRSLNFRLAMDSDLPEVWQLFSDAVWHMNSQNIPQWDEIYPNRQTLSDDIEKQQMYLLTENDAVVSAVVLNEEQDVQYQTGCWKYVGGKIAVIHRLCVKASEQNKGVGRKTMLLAEQELFRQGYDSVRLDAFTLNPFSQKLYESIGYQKTGEVTFRKGKFYLYEKVLHTQERWR